MKLEEDANEVLVQSIKGWSLIKWKRGWETREKKSFFSPFTPKGALDANRKKLAFVEKKDPRKELGNFFLQIYSRIVKSPSIYTFRKNTSKGIFEMHFCSLCILCLRTNGAAYFSSRRDKTLGKEEGKEGRRLLQIIQLLEIFQFPFLKPSTSYFEFRPTFVAKSIIILTIVGKTSRQFLLKMK